MSDDLHPNSPLALGITEDDIDALDPTLVEHIRREAIASFAIAWADKPDDVTWTIEEFAEYVMGDANVTVLVETFRAYVREVDAT